MNDRLPMVRAPWTDEQVAALNEYQVSGIMHPFTCREKSSHGPAGCLRATNEGWVCDEDGCDYTQGWAHEFMASGMWRGQRHHRDKLFSDLVDHEKDDLPEVGSLWVDE